jgi:hypothetical protein
VAGLESKLSLVVVEHGLGFVGDFSNLLLGLVLDWRLDSGWRGRNELHGLWRQRATGSSNRESAASHAGRSTWWRLDGKLVRVVLKGWEGLSIIQHQGTSVVSDLRVLFILHACLSLSLELGDYVVLEGSYWRTSLGDDGLLGIGGRRSWKVVATSLAVEDVLLNLGEKVVMHETIEAKAINRTSLLATRWSRHHGAGVGGGNALLSRSVLGIGERRIGIGEFCEDERVVLVDWVEIESF